MEQSLKKLPLVEIFETVEGEGMKAGFPTVFIRLFGCNLRCTWCDTKYSYAPYQPEYFLSIKKIKEKVSSFNSKHICLTGGEPLLFGDHSVALIHELLTIEGLLDIHIETNGSIDLEKFINDIKDSRVRYVMDYKLSSSSEKQKMNNYNLTLLRSFDEVKFVIGSDEDFKEASELVQRFNIRAQIMCSPVWESMSPNKLVQKILELGIPDIKLNLQLHKIIWDPSTRGV